MFDPHTTAREWTRQQEATMSLHGVTLTPEEHLIANRAFEAGVSAARKELGADEGRHIAEVRADGSWVVQHPLHERAGGSLFTCPFNNLFLDTEGLAVGRYHLELPDSLGGNLKWTPLEVTNV